MGVWALCRMVSDESQSHTFYKIKLPVIYTVRVWYKTQGVEKIVGNLRQKGTSIRGELTVTIIAHHAIA